MFDHITIRVADRSTAEAFYETVLRTIGVERSGRDEQYTVWGGDFSLASADNRNTVTRRLHIGFVAPSRVHVDAFWQAGVGPGPPSEGEPGPRPEYGPEYYGGFRLDPDGNSVEAVHHGRGEPPRRCCRPGRGGTRRNTRARTPGAGRVRPHWGGRGRPPPARRRRRALATARRSRCATGV